MNSKASELEEKIVDILGRDMGTVVRNSSGSPSQGFSGVFITIKVNAFKPRTCVQFGIDQNEGFYNYSIVYNAYPERDLT